MLLLSVFCSLFSPIDASEATLFRSYDRPLPPQTYTHSFRISGTLHGKHVSFDVFGTYHPFPVDQYHPHVKKFLLNHQYLAVKNLNVFKKRCNSWQEYIRSGFCTETPNPFFEGLDLTLLRETYKPLDDDLKRLFNFVKNHSNALVTCGYMHLYHPQYGLLARFKKLGLLVQILNFDGSFLLCSLIRA